MNLQILLVIVCILLLLSICIGVLKKGKDIQTRSGKVDIKVNKANDTKSQSKLDKRFYEVNETFPELNQIYDDLDNIKKEVTNLTDEDGAWNDWPETELYATDSNWKIIPFKAFDVTVEENCDRFPHLWRFISSVPNVRVAIISKLAPRMKLNPHQGWGDHSNHVLRCHFGLSIPLENTCYISVADEFDKIKNIPIDEEIQFHSQDKWMVFDDSKHHYAENPTKFNRIVLIMDIDRPSHIKTGTSKVNDTKELMDIVKSFRK